MAKQTGGLDSLLLSNMFVQTLTCNPTESDSLCNIGAESSDRDRSLHPARVPIGPEEPKPHLRSAGQYDCESSDIAEQVFELDDLIPCKTEVETTLLRSLSDVGGNHVNPLQ